jgi:hypothetical protein
MGVKLGLSFDARTLAELLKNRVLREIFWAKRDEVTAEWERVHNGQLYDLHCSLCITGSFMICTVHCA